jgi:hypothetical protein
MDLEIIESCNWDICEIYKLHGIEKTTEKLLVLLDESSIKYPNDFTIFISILKLAEKFTFYDDQSDSMSENDVILCRKYFEDSNFYDKLEKYLYNPFHQIIESVIRTFGYFCSNNNHLLKSNVKYLIKAFVDEYYNKNPFIAGALLLSIVHLNERIFIELLSKVIENQNPINIITLCFVAKIYIPMNSMLNIIYNKYCIFFEKIPYEKFETFISTLQALRNNILYNLTLKEWDRDTYLKLIQFWKDNFENYIIASLKKPDYENIYNKILEIEL